MFDLGFGDPVLIRDNLVNFSSNSFRLMGYRLESVQEKWIVEWVKAYYKDRFNLNYDHIILTHGASHGLGMLVKKLKSSNDVFCFDHMAFSWYKKIMEMEGVKYSTSADMSKEQDNYSTQYIIDSPTNPWGNQVFSHNLDSKKVIWDSVYASKVYVKGPLAYPPHNVMVGSLSKFLGLSGLRIGWVGTNDPILANQMREFTKTSTCGLSTPSLIMASEIVTHIYLNEFEKKAADKLDFHRERFDKLSKIFSLGAPANGMFYMGVLDNANKKILEKAQVKGIEMTSSKGTEYIRLNMAQSEATVDAALKAISKADRKSR